MEAVFFRFLAREMASALAGARVEKVYLPAPNTISLALYLPFGRAVPGLPPKRTLYLHARYGSGRFFLFLSAQKTAQPDRAPAEAMRLRKHVRARRVERVLGDWPRRRLLLVMAGDGPHLLLDPRTFPALVTAVPEDFEGTATWPPLDVVLAEPDIWQAHPHLSPELRRRLAGLPRDAAEALYAGAARDVSDGFFVEYRQGMPEAVWPWAWPQQAGQARAVRRFETALAAAAAFGEPLVFGEVLGREAAPEAAARAATKRRLARALAKLDADEARMRAFIARRREADALAANLHALDGRAKQTRVTVPGERDEPLEVVLDPSLTVVQNMQRLYRLVAKGERGLAAIAARRRDLQDEKKYLKGREHGTTQTRPAQARPGSIKGVAAHCYRTSDGFLALRGRNAAANDKLLRLASPFDFWLHVADGPGAHVIVRRDHPGRDVPRQSLEEAAGLAALASYASGAAKADVLVARVADVRRIKGAAMGRVSVEAVLMTLRVALDPALEKLREPE